MTLSSTTDRMLRASMKLKPLRQRTLPRVSPQAAELMELSERRNFDFQVLGRAPMLIDSIFTGTWWISPVEKDQAAPIPERAMERVKAVYDSGIRPKGWVIAHEVPGVLTSGKKEEETAPWWMEWKRGMLSLIARPLLLVGIGVSLALIIPIVIGYLIQIAAGVIAALILPLVVLGVAGVALADPVLIAVTEDNYWVEIDRWV